MITIKTLKELKNNQELIKKLNITNFQQTYENIYSLHKSNKTSITFINNNLLTVLHKRDENIYECSLNIEPIIIDNQTSKEIISFIKEIQVYLNKTIYFPLVYEDSKFYKLLKNNLYKYERLYTSLIDYSKIKTNIINHINLSKRVYFSERNVKKFENNLNITYYTKVDVKDILTEIETSSWKHLSKQDMVTKKEQLIYYNSIVKQGLASIAVAKTKDNQLVSYRLDAIYNNKIHVLKNSYKEEYKKYSPGSYMLIKDLYEKYKNYKYVDLYGGPGLAKEMIETSHLKRYDFVIGKENIIKDLEEKRKKWDYKNYSNYIEGNSIKEVFMKKTNVLAVTSVFGLGPVGKLNAIIEAGKNDFNWYAAGEEFDLNIFSNNIFKDTCFTMDKDNLNDFLKKHNIKYAIVVLKNKMARLLLELGIKVVYVDSLPFMWSNKDAQTGKVPYNVDCYCAQKTIELNKQSQEIFNKVKNLKWINPIVNPHLNKEIKIKDKNFILINLGGLHSPNTNGDSYINIVLKTLLTIYKDKHIIIMTSTISKMRVQKLIDIFASNKIKVRTVSQELFYNYIKKADLFFTSPGLTTILESSFLDVPVILLPPQNLSQFYNIEYAKKIFKEYKEISWNNKDLTLNGLSKYLSKDEHGVIEEINERIDKLNNNIYKREYLKYIQNILDSKYQTNNIKNNNNTGAIEVINYLKEVIDNEKN